MSHSGGANPSGAGRRRTRRSGSSRDATPRGGRADSGQNRRKRRGDRSKATRARGGGGSWIDQPSRKYRSKTADDEETQPSSGRPALRKSSKKSGGKATGKTKGARSRATVSRSRQRPRRPGRITEASEELQRLAGNRAPRAIASLEAATAAFSSGRAREAAGHLRPLRDAYPNAAAVRELLGLAQYRQGNFRAAAIELEAFVELTGSAEQHPVLMDCYRARQRYGDVEALWLELRDASPSAALVIEGRIVAAGALADKGDLGAAITLLERKATEVRNPAPHHLRLWYALADLRERAGELPETRRLLERIARSEPGFADVAERLASL